MDVDCVCGAIPTLHAYNFRSLLGSIAALLIDAVKLSHPAPLMAFLCSSRCRDDTLERESCL